MRVSLRMFLHTRHAQMVELKFVVAGTTASVTRDGFRASNRERATNDRGNLFPQYFIQIDYKKFGMNRIIDNTIG